MPASATITRATVPEPVGQRADQRRRDDLGPDRRGKDERDLLRVEAASGEPHRPERQLYADHQKCRRIERRQPGSGPTVMSRRHNIVIRALDAAALRAYVAGVLMDMTS